MALLIVHNDAKQDLLVMARNGLKADAVRVAMLLEQLANDEDLLDRLTQHGFGRRGIDTFNISKWLDQWRKGNDLWRLKIWEVMDYRVIYAFIPQQHEYHVLGVVHREFNYEPDHIATQRIKRAYEDLR